MNIFRLTGDILHLLSILILAWKVHRQRNSVGVSLKTVELYGLVFVCRYLDIFVSFISLYNTTMKIFYLAATFWLIYVIRYKFPDPPTRAHDTFKLPWVIVPCFVLALLINDEFTFMEVLWSFSIYLESVAILPQIFLMYRTREVENFAAEYVVTLGLYRLFYIFNWIYRWYQGDNWINYFVWIAGIVQTLLYVDFFYFYAYARWYGKEIQLPV